MSQIQQIKDALNIVEIINQRVDLKRAGRNWRGLCPFHTEKSPSFFVSDQLQRFKCFGCAETGDVYQFLEKYEGITFAEALKYLAELSGIKLKEYQPTQQDQEREQFLEVLSLAKEYYHYLLTKHKAGIKAREYLKKRKTNQTSIELFQLGYSLSTWDGLVKYLHHKKKYPLALLVKTGLIINSKGRYYDRFRDRLMFPLKNHRGQVVGFSGRVILPDESFTKKMSSKTTLNSQPKYINTPETSLYHKAELLYGYSELLQFIRKNQSVIVTEGEFDVISSTQAHVNNIVAIKGSAFTLAHAKYLKRIANQVIFALDFDEAGLIATQRAIPIAQQAGLELRVIQLSDLTSQQKKDPDDLARETPQFYRKLVKSSVSIYQFLIQSAVAKNDPTSAEGKKAIIKELAEPFSKIELAIEKDYYQQVLAKKLKVKQSIIVQDLNNQTVLKQPKTQQTDQFLILSQQRLSRRQRVELYLWFLLFKSEPAQLAIRIKKLAVIKFSNPSQQLLLEKLKNFKSSPSLEKLRQTLPEDLQQLLFDLHLQPAFLAHDNKIDLDQEWHKALQELSTIDINDQIKNITIQLNELDSKQIKTLLEEQRQQALLEKVVLLKSKV